jgi:PDZ domain
MRFMEEYRMNGTFLRKSAWAMIFAAGIWQGGLERGSSAQEFNGANAEGELNLPPPVRPGDSAQVDAEQQLDSSAPQFDNAEQQFDNTAQPLDNAAPYLGITFDPAFPDSAVARFVAPDGPAAQAGIQPGDTIEAINDRPVSSYRDAYEIVEAMRPGEIIDIDFSRRMSGRTQAVIGRRPSDNLQTQGPFLQGPFLQGPSLQGPSLQGPSLQGPSLQGPSLQGPSLQGPSEDLPTADYASEETTRAAPSRAGGSMAYDRLPLTPRLESRSRRFPDYSQRAYGTQTYELREDIRLEERRPEDRPPNRVRADRGLRNRPLLRWRRN